jgi:hypothetical protein
LNFRSGGGLDLVDESEDAALEAAPGELSEEASTRPRPRTSTQLVFYLLYVIVLCALLIAVCWRKGEPPRWRWGER